MTEVRIRNKDLDPMMYRWFVGRVPRDLYTWINAPGCRVVMFEHETDALAFRLAFKV